MKCKKKSRYVAIVDYGLGNLFSVKQACRNAGVDSVVTSIPDEILNSSAVILTGVGAFKNAMKRLTDNHIADTLRNYVLTGRPVVGICLGMQLLMTESYEFGRHTGLNIIKGKVIKLKTAVTSSGTLKVPHIGWSRINLSSGWKGTLLEGIPGGTHMYFVHSYFVELAEENLSLSKTSYGTNEFCSAVCSGNVSAFQFHPECSGRYGLKIYENLAKKI